MSRKLEFVVLHLIHTGLENSKVSFFLILFLDKDKVTFYASYPSFTLVKVKRLGKSNPWDNRAHFFCNQKVERPWGNSCKDCKKADSRTLEMLPAQFRGFSDRKLEKWNREEPVQVYNKPRWRRNAENPLLANNRRPHQPLDRNQKVTHLNINHEPPTSSIRGPKKFFNLQQDKLAKSRCKRPKHSRARNSSRR